MGEAVIVEEGVGVGLSVIVGVGEGVGIATGDSVGVGIGVGEIVGVAAITRNCSLARWLSPTGEAAACPL